MINQFLRTKGLLMLYPINFTGRKSHHTLISDINTNPTTKIKVKVAFSKGPIITVKPKS